MLVQKEIVATALESACKKILNDKTIINSKMNELLVQYNVPQLYSSDLFTLRNSFLNESNQILYYFTMILIPEKTEIYFTPAEIKSFSSSKFKSKKTKFPLKFKMIQIAEDQFIGSVSTKELMDLRDSQLIHYNSNTQRKLIHIVSGEIEYVKTNVIQKKVDDIQSLMKAEQYIPNTITLNLAEDADYFYNEETNELVIKNLSHFDITDGYHRYLAWSNEYNLNKNFDLTMELRITCFLENKAQHFIWEQDQQTKLEKVDSDSMNQTKISNKIVSRINFDTTSNLSGKINRNNYIIDSSQLSKVVELVFLKDRISKKDEMVTVISLSKQISKKLNIITEADYKLLTKKWNFKYLTTAMVVFGEDIADDKLLDVIDETYYKAKELKFSPSNISIYDINRIKKMIGE